MKNSATPAFVVPEPHVKESQRLVALHDLNLLDTQAEARFDRITQLVAKVLGIETVLVSLVDENRQWFKSICNLDATETSRDVSFCGHAINEPGDALVVPDAEADSRFRHNPLVTGAPKIRCYAGVVLRSPGGLPLGTLCTIGYEARAFDEDYLIQLRGFAEIVEYELYRSSWGLDQDPAKPTSVELVAQADGVVDALGAMSFDGVLAMRDQRSVIAVTARLPRIDSLARAYGNTIVDELIEEIERRLKLAVRAYPHHMERGERGTFKLCVGLPTNIESEPLPHLRALFLENLGRRFQTMRVTIATPLRIGMSRPALPDCNTDDLLRCAELACEHMTSTRAGPVCKFYDAQMGEVAGRYRSVSANVLNAMENGELRIVLQPKVSVADGRVSGLEALIRWDHDELGPVSPPEILQALEDLDRIPSFDLWVLNTACQLLSQWAQDGLDLVPVAVNLCGTTLMEPKFPERARAIAAAHNVAPHLIEFEILESVVVDDLDHATSQIALCRQAGFQVALDDFGAGQTSLAYLGSLPVDTVKIDQSFVNDVVTNAEASGLLLQILGMCKSLGKRTVVEGVETPGQYLLLRSFGCDFIQGYYFAKPMPISEAAKLISPERAFIAPQGLDGL